MTEKSDDEPETGARKQPCVCMGEVCAWVRCVYMGRVCMCGWSESFYTRSIIVYGASTNIADNHTHAYTLDACISNQHAQILHTSWLDLCLCKPCRQFF